MPLLTGSGSQKVPEGLVSKAWTVHSSLVSVNGGVVEVSIAWPQRQVALGRRPMTAGFMSIAWTSPRSTERPRPLVQSGTRLGAKDFHPLGVRSGPRRKVAGIYRAGIYPKWVPGAAGIYPKWVPGAAGIYSFV